MGPILVVEDDESLAEATKYSLQREGYAVATASDGRQGLSKFRSDRPCLVLLDLMLPEISGLDLCRLFRAESIVPIVVVTAKGSEPDKIASLEMGADDYITKPFSVQELIARVRAQLRRMAMMEKKEQPSVLKVGVIEMDIGSHIIEVRGERLALPPKEFALLRMLLESPGRLMTREILISEVWGPDYVGDTRTLDVHIKRLRAKIEDDPAHPKLLNTVRGLGYKFEPA
ncbi:MAG: response regulator transcription factor [Actinobacteria bacterium]|nr:response regulator transcription factor [Actinomycetota bacterium]